MLRAAGLVSEQETAPRSGSSWSLWGRPPVPGHETPRRAAGWYARGGWNEVAANAGRNAGPDGSWLIDSPHMFAPSSRADVLFAALPDGTCYESGPATAAREGPLPGGRPGRGPSLFSGCQPANGQPSDSADGM
ncbi:hypothetical protein GCM10010300_53440 [Streptomyces olivaceoviridis]|nr:hypothetical protein GCM10010300_53440 [Streptomyces olivaceoviridis]